MAPFSWDPGGPQKGRPQAGPPAEAGFGRYITLPSATFLTPIFHRYPTSVTYQAASDGTCGNNSAGSGACRSCPEGHGSRAAWAIACMPCCNGQHFAYYCAGILVQDWPLAFCCRVLHLNVQGFSPSNPMPPRGWAPRRPLSWITPAVYRIRLNSSSLSTNVTYAMKKRCIQFFNSYFTIVSWCSMDIPALYQLVCQYLLMWRDR